MRALVLVLAVAASCKTETNYPVGGGGGGGGGGVSFTDAAIDGAGSGSAVALACVLIDPRDLTSCKGTGTGMLTVKLGTQTATTADDGTFTIAVPTGTNLQWDVTSPTGTVVESVTPYTGQTRIPVMDSQMFIELQGNVGAQAIAGTGGLLARVVRGTQSVAGEQATVVPANTLGAFYDGASASSWRQTGTGQFGTVFVPNVGSGTATLKLSANGTIDATLGAIPITDGGVTFVVAEVP